MAPTAATWEAWEEADSRFGTRSLPWPAATRLLTGVLETLNVIRAQAEWTSLRRGTLTRADPARLCRPAPRAGRCGRRARPAAADGDARTHLDAVRAAMIGGAADAATFVPDA